MNLTITLRFNPRDSCDVFMAITEEDTKKSAEELLAMVKPAIEVLHHNLQRYDNSPKPAYVEINDWREASVPVATLA